MTHSRLPNNTLKYFIQALTGLKIKTKRKYKLNCGISSQMSIKKWNNPRNCCKIAKKSLFFPLFWKKSFLNRTLGLIKSFWNQTTYVCAKISVVTTSFLKSRFFLKSSFHCSRMHIFAYQITLQRNSVAFKQGFFYPCFFYKRWQEAFYILALLNFLFDLFLACIVLEIKLCKHASKNNLSICNWQAQPNWVCYHQMSRTTV